MRSLHIRVAMTACLLADAMKPADQTVPPAHSNAPNGSSSDEVEPHYGMVDISTASRHMWTGDMLQAVHEALKARQQLYHYKTVEEDEAELAALSGFSR